MAFYHRRRLRPARRSGGGGGRNCSGGGSGERDAIIATLDDDDDGDGASADCNLAHNAFRRCRERRTLKGRNRNPFHPSESLCLLQLLLYLIQSPSLVTLAVPASFLLRFAPADLSSYPIEGGRAHCNCISACCCRAPGGGTLTHVRLAGKLVIGKIAPLILTDG